MLRFVLKDVSPADSSRGPGALMTPLRHEAIRFYLRSEELPPYDLRRNSHKCRVVLGPAVSCLPKLAWVDYLREVGGCSFLHPDCCKNTAKWSPSLCHIWLILFSKPFPSPCAQADEMLRSRVDEQMAVDAFKALTIWLIL